MKTLWCIDRTNRFTKAVRKEHNATDTEKIKCFIGQKTEKDYGLPYYSDGNWCFVADIGCQHDIAGCGINNGPREVI